MIEKSHLYLSTILLYITIIAMAIPSANNASAAFSSPENPSLESLKSDVDRLRDGPQTWQRRYMWLAGLTVAVGGFMLVSQFMQNRASTNLEKAQSALSERQELLRVSREERVARDLKEKDVSIAAANEAAAKANELGGRANERAVLVGLKRTPTLAIPEAIRGGPYGK